MLKLKHAVNSFVITKKKFNKNKRMRGGAAQEQVEAKVVAVKPLFDALTKAIDEEFENCTQGIDQALSTKSPDDIILLNKKRIFIKILLHDLDAVQQKMNEIIDTSLGDLKQTLLSKSVDQKRSLETNLEKIEGPVKPLPDLTDLYPLSRIKKILDLFVINDGTIVPVENIEQLVTKENTEYQTFLDQVAAKSNSTGSNVGATTSKITGEYKVTIDNSCTPENCSPKVEKVQRGGGRKTRNKRRKGARKSQNKKILKGGRRRR
jgi:hypothetical protein